jgi:chromate transporter
VIAAVALFFKADVLLVVVGCGVLGIVLTRKGQTDKGSKRSSGEEIKGSSEDEGGRMKDEGGNGKDGRSKSEVRSLRVDGRSGVGADGQSEIGNRKSKMLSVVPFLPLLFVAVAVPGVWQRVWELAFVFLKVGTVIFGGGFAAIPFLQHEVVDVHHWLSMREFIDGVALGQITPGPVAITAAFIGYKVLGFWGALIAALGTFLPSSLMLWGLIKVYRRVSSNVLVQGFLSGVMPAVTGMLLVSTVFIGRSAITGPAQVVLALLSLGLLLWPKVEPVWLILGGALVGIVIG